MYMKNRALASAAKTITPAVAATLAAVAALAIGAPAASHADNTGTDAALAPIESASQTVYRYFDAPVSVFADAGGRLVAEKDRITAVSPDMTFSVLRDVGADKLYRRGEVLYTLEDGALRSYYGDAVTTFGEAAALPDDGSDGSDGAQNDNDNIRTADHEVDGFIDFAVCGDKLYALSPAALTVIPLGELAFADGAETVELVSTEHHAVEATAIAVAADDCAYIAVDSPIFRNKQDIARVDTSGAVETVVPETDRLYALTATADTLYALTHDAVTGYAVGSGMTVTHRLRGTRFTDIYAATDGLYALNALDALCFVPFGLSDYTLLAASAADAEGFFNIPSAAAVKNSTLYVADTVNGRIAAYGDTLEYVGGKFDNPVSVASDSTGALYVAHGGNTVSRIADGETTSYTIDGAIRSVAVDSDKNMYILARNGLWYAKRGETPVKVSDVKYRAITLGVGREGLFALDGDTVKRLTVADGAVTEFDYVTVGADAFSIAVDLDGNVFALSRTAIDKYERVYGGSKTERFELTLHGEPYELGFTSGQILLSTVGNAFTEYGGAIIVDTYKHRMFTADGATLGIKLVDSSDYEDPKLEENDEPAYYGEGLIRVALYDAQVFSMPTETKTVYTIAEGRKVIVPEYDLTESREYSLILIDDLSTGRLIEGYVYKDALSEPLAYSAPPSDVGTVYSNATPVYKWPSPNAKTVKGFSAVERSTQFKVLDFVEPYRDDYDNLWYRISIAEECEGYILAANLSLLDYEPVFIRPAYNAEIISYEESEYAQAYKLENGEYIPLEVTLDTGTKVEVVGVYDTSLEYTEVKYLDEKLGTLTCYVKTVYLKYNGVNIVPIVATAVIIITVALAAIIIGRVVYVKKKRLITPTDERGNMTA